MSQPQGYEYGRADPDTRLLWSGIDTQVMYPQPLTTSSSPESCRQGYDFAALRRANPELYLSSTAEKTLAVEAQVDQPWWGEYSGKAGACTSPGKHSSA